MGFAVEEELETQVTVTAVCLRAAVTCAAVTFVAVSVVITVHPPLASSKFSLRPNPRILVQPGGTGGPGQNAIGGACRNSQLCESPITLGFKGLTKNIGK